MRKSLLLAIVIAASTASGYAQTQSTISFGQPDCGQWVRDGRAADRAWLLGYLSGMNRIHNIWGHGPADPLDTLNSAEQAVLWMDNWCKANPLKGVGLGGLELLLELMKMKSNR